MLPVSRSSRGGGGDAPNQRSGVADEEDGADETVCLTLLGSGSDDVAAGIAVQKVPVLDPYTTEKKCATLFPSSMSQANGCSFKVTRKK